MVKFRTWREGSKKKAGPEPSASGEQTAWKDPMGHIPRKKRGPGELVVFTRITPSKLKSAPHQSAGKSRKSQAGSLARAVQNNYSRSGVNLLTQSHHPVKSIPSQSPTSGKLCSASGPSTASPSPLPSLPPCSEHHPSNQHNANSAQTLGSRHLSPKSSKKKK